jgi:hypothetical protein
VNEHRLYIVLGILLLCLGALFVRRADAIGATAFIIADLGIVVNGSRALKKRFVPHYSPAMARLRIGVLVLAIVLAIAVILLQERW